MPASPFTPFSREHLAAVVVGAVLVGALLVAGRSGWRGRNLSAALLAFANLVSYPLNQAAWLSLGTTPPLDNILPLHLCDIAAMVAGFALITRRPLLCALTYFWGLAATFQALLTPALGTGFPSWPFLTFFLQHFAIVATALFLPIVDGWRPRQPLWRGPLEVYAWSVGYMGFALAVNALLDTNFGFVTRPPDNPSLIDHLGPWPWYLGSLQAIAFGAFLLLALPHAFSARRPRDEGAPAHDGAIGPADPPTQ